MGLWHMCLYLSIFIVVCASQKNTTKLSNRRGKALKISKKPCSDPTGRKGICTFKWDCINQNGTLMGTCMDGFIFGTCCQYDHDPLLTPHDDSFVFPSPYESNYIHDDHRRAPPHTTRRTTTTTTAIPTKRVSIFTTRRPTTTTTRPPPTTTRPPPVILTTRSTTTTPRTTVATTTRSTALQLVTWTSVGPTRPSLIPQRPIILAPFPFRPGLNFNPGIWPSGIAFPVVNPFNRPPVVYRPPPLQTAQSNVVKRNTTFANGTSFTIFNSGKRNTTVSMTTVSVPIPQWSTSTTASVVGRPTPPAIVRPPLLYASVESSTASSVTTTTTKRPNLDYRKDCGVRALGPKGRIVGGQSSPFGRWPWQVLVKEAAWLGLYQKNKCGGVLVSNKFAITAGHCQPGRFLSSLVVIMGEHDLLSDRESRMKPEMRRVKRMIVHRHYNPHNFDNDIAVLELDVPVVFKPHISPICLPEPAEDFTGKMAFVTGWGKTTHGGSIPNLLQEVQVPIMSNRQCVDMFREAGHTKLIKDSFLCAGYKVGGKDSCEGDSGGPLMVERDTGQWVLAGTVSHGIRCADANLPGVYMRIAAYRPWIDKVMKI